MWGHVTSRTRHVSLWRVLGLLVVCSAILYVPVRELLENLDEKRLSADFAGVSYTIVIDRIGMPDAQLPQQTAIRTFGFLMKDFPPDGFETILIYRRHSRDSLALFLDEHGKVKRSVRFRSL